MIRFLIALLSLGLATTASAQTKEQWEAVGQTGMTTFVWIAKEAEGDRAIYDQAIAKLCSGKSHC